MPKNKKAGYWIEEKKHDEPGMSFYICSECGKIGGVWVEHLKASRTKPECPWCLAEMSGKRVEYAK